ncbi:hypothetical protein OG21DRAFT_1601635 [Imleria badia]|nr:hypothetical protein OG21DRAFT_1601635 [Imleria badia]
MANLNENLLSSLAFTRSVGIPLDDNVTFNDATTVGRYPLTQNIRKIVRIQLFASEAVPMAVIAGLRVTYLMNGAPLPPVLHGLETPHVVCDIQMPANQLLVGASGKVKESPNQAINGRISFIVFTVYENDTGLTIVRGPFGSTEYVTPKSAWGCYGPIIAFQGTVAPKLGLTSLGFAKPTQGLPGMGILGA